MKKKFLLFSMATVSAIAIITYSQEAKAVPEGLAVRTCTVTNDKGVIVSVGCTCADSDSSCIANPCTS